MKILVAVLLSSVATVSAETPAKTASAEENAASGLRPRIYDLAGVLCNEGFKVRDGSWMGSLKGDKPRRLAVNLFAGNEYWFVGATSEPGEIPAISLRDPSGRLVEAVRFDKDGVAAVGVTAAVTGRYIIEFKGSASSSREFCLIYLFK